MAFNSIAYYVFFAATFAIAFGLSRFVRLRTGIILMLSLVFYYIGNGWLVILLLAVSTIDYLVCRIMAGTVDAKRRKLLLAISLCSNLGILGFFKYSNFFQDNV